MVGRPTEMLITLHDTIDPLCWSSQGGDVSTAGHIQATMNEGEWRRLVRTRSASLSDFLSWAQRLEQTPGQSVRLKHRQDLGRVRHVLPLFQDPWWGVVVYSCFDSVRGTEAVADSFREPISGDRAAGVLHELKLPPGSVQHHRTQPGHRGAKIALVSACEHVAEVRYVLHDLDGFHERFEALRALDLPWWGRTTCYDLLIRTGLMGIGGGTYEPMLVYLADSTGPAKGFRKVWGIQVSKDNAEFCEGVLQMWSSRWNETCSQLGIPWTGRPYSSGDFENALCIYQEHHRSRGT